MICPFCNTETDGVNHNDRGLKCPACWYPLPTPEPEPEATIMSSNEFDAGVVSVATYEKLIEAGVETLSELRGETDGELLAIDGIGRATLAKLRAHYGR